MNHFNLNNINNTDLNLYQCGAEDCNISHAFGPAVRDHYLIHFITSGKGIFDDGRNLYNLEKGQGFLICPDIVTYYQADSKEPWNYMWAGFHGLKAQSFLGRAGLSRESPIFSVKKVSPLKQWIQKMIKIKEITKSKELKLTGLLYLFLSDLIENIVTGSEINNFNRQKEYIKKAVEYIEKNYSREIKVKDISKYLGLHRSYLYTIFKEKLSISPQEYIIKYRINKACELMKNTNLTIGDISRSVGYNDPMNFSKIFKKKKNIAPTEFRKIEKKEGK
ncbi:MAG: AraC family transcriptional regulator [Bacillota bacterium]